MDYLSVYPPAFQQQTTDKEKISTSLWSHWSGKSKESVAGAFSQLQKVNGATLLTIQRLLKEEKQVISCQFPGLLISISQGVFSHFPTYVSDLLEKAISVDKTLRHQIIQSDGLLKTPILITRNTHRVTIMRPESLIPLTSSICFYPYVETAQCSDGSMLTLYINDSIINEADLIRGLRKGLIKAVKTANALLPQLPDISSITEWSDLFCYYEVQSYRELLTIFKISNTDELPVLSDISSWSDLPDKYLLSREIIQKYLR